MSSFPRALRGAARGAARGATPGAGRNDQVMGRGVAERVPELQRAVGDSARVLLRGGGPAGRFAHICSGTRLTPLGLRVHLQVADDSR